MQISYFEEFPTKDNISRLKLISNCTKLYLAAPCLKRFLTLSKKLDQQKLKEAIYWPILKKKEGYWISPFSQRKALQRVFSELKNQKISVMLDLELPTTKNPWLYLTQFFNFFRNKRLIQRFIADYNGQVYLAEYYPEGKKKEKILEFLGLHYHNPKVKVIKMLYHSLHHFDEKFIINELKRGKKEFGERHILALGTIARGVNGNEPLLSPNQLKQDLKLAKEAGIQEVIIFRLGGLDEEYLEIINQFH